MDAKVGDTVILSFAANATTGYEWTFTAGDTFTIEKSEYVPDPNPDQLAGKGGAQVVTLKVTKAGESDLTGTYARSWETPSPGAGPDVTVTVKSGRSSRGRCRRRSRQQCRTGTPRRTGMAGAAAAGGRGPGGAGGPGGPPARSPLRTRRRPRRRDPAAPPCQAGAPGRYPPCAGSRDPEVSMDDPVLSRRSIRKYTDQPVDDATVERLLRAAMAAPSAGNQQPWQFVVLRDRATLTAITEWHPYAKMLPSAPVAIVVCGDPGDAKWAVLWDQDCSACTENLLIEAELLGLGAVWLGVHPLAGARARRCARCSASPRPWCRSPSSRRLAGGAQGAVRPLRRGPRAPRALVSAPAPRAVDSLSRPARGYVCHSTRDAAGAALRPGAGETGSAPRVLDDAVQTERRGEP